MIELGYDILLQKYLTECRTLSAKDYGGMGLISDKSLDSMEQEMSGMKDALTQNEDYIDDIMNAMHTRLTTFLFHASEDFQEDLKNAVMRCSSYDKNNDGYFSRDGVSSEDRAKRLQAEHDLIHSVYRSMNPKSEDGEFDVDLVVGGFTFNCHARILSLQSNYFAEKFKTHSGGKSWKRLKIPSVNPDTFMVVLRYMYISEFYPVSFENLFQVTKAAVNLSIKTVIKRCTEAFRERQLFVNLVDEWAHMTSSKIGMKLDVQQFFNDGNFLTSSNLYTLFFVLDNPNIQIKQETDLCDLFVAWLVGHAGKEEKIQMILKSIGWSSVPEEYVRTKLLSHEHIQSYPEVVDFLMSLLDYYYPHGIPLELQKTSIRTSLGHEKCFVSVEKDEFGNFNVASRQLQKSPVQSYLMEPGEYRNDLNDGMSGAVYHDFAGGCNSWQRDTLYLTGTGKDCVGIWKYDISTGWSECSNMVVGRKHHSSVFVGSKLFSLGGVGLGTIEEFDINSNTSVMRKANFEYMIDSACVAYKESIYLFGGIYEGECSDRVLRYDTEADQTILYFDEPMPGGLSGLVPVVCGDMIILLHEKTCYIYNVKKRSWTLKENFKTNLQHFAAVIEDRSIYIFGGMHGHTSKPTSDPTSDQTSDPISDLISDLALNPKSDPSVNPTSKPTSDSTSDPKLNLKSNPKLDSKSDLKSDPKSDPKLVQSRVDDQAVVLSVAIPDLTSSDSSDASQSPTHSEWSWYGNLDPRPAQYLAYGSMTAPSTKFKDGSWTWVSQ